MIEAATPPRAERVVGDHDGVAAQREPAALPKAAYQYRLADNAVAFWFRFVHGNRSRLRTGAMTEVWQHHVEPWLNEYMGKVFERICHQAFQRHHAHWGLDGAHVWARWEGEGRNRRSIEIDAVARQDSARN